MGWKINRNDERLMSEINITPLTDVMLVLLVIFMVTTPLIMTESFKIKLPKAAAGSSEPGKGVIVAVSSEGLLSLNGKEIKAEELYDRLRKEFGSGTDKTVVVKADGSALHGIVVKVLDTAKSAGAQKLSIATERK